MFRAKDCLLILFSLFFQFSHAQNIPFTSVNPFIGEIPVISEYLYGSGISFFDVDEDGWDDLTICNHDSNTQFYKNQFGLFSLQYSFPNTKNAKSCVWADLNEDGINDLVVSRYDAPSQIFLGAGNNNYNLVDLGLENPFMPNESSIGLAIGDLNRDGFLDIAIANYSMNTPNRIYINEQGQHFEPINIPEINNNVNLSFQPCWIDLNNDLYPELFIINDHEQNHELYDFSGENISENALIHNLIFPSNAMSNSWEDFDRDGDMDLYVSNNQNLPNFLFTNDGAGIFTDISEVKSKLYNLESWSGLWIDSDNDSWSDLFVCTRGGYNGFELLNNKYFRNIEGYLIETECPNLTSLETGFFSNAKGDVNNDGLSDLAITPETSGPYSSAEYAMNHFIYLNTSEANNNFFKFRLAGRLSNRNGFGTKYTAYFDSSLVSGYTMSSGNYLGQNSQNIIIGLGQSSVIDSLVLV